MCCSAVHAAVWQGLLRHACGRRVDRPQGEARSCPLLCHLLCTSRPINEHLVDATIFYSADSGGVKTYLTAKSHWLARHTSIRHTIVAPALHHLEQEAGLVTKPNKRKHKSNNNQKPETTQAAAHTLQ